MSTSRRRLVRSCLICTRSSYLRTHSKALRWRLPRTLDTALCRKIVAQIVVQFAHTEFGQVLKASSLFPATDSHSPQSKETESSRISLWLSFKCAAFELSAWTRSPDSPESVRLTPLHLQPADRDLESQVFSDANWPQNVHQSPTHSCLASSIVFDSNCLPLAGFTSNPFASVWHLIRQSKMSKLAFSTPQLISLIDCIDEIAHLLPPINHFPALLFLFALSLVFLVPFRFAYLCELSKQTWLVSRLDKQTSKTTANPWQSRLITFKHQKWVFVYALSLRKEKGVGKLLI
jgi:hypothetical protein